MTITVCADEVRPGDVIVYAGQTHRIIDVARCLGWAWPVATDGTGWAIALGHNLVTASRQ